MKGGVKDPIVIHDLEDDSDVGDDALREKIVLSDDDDESPTSTHPTTDPSRTNVSHPTSISRMKSEAEQLCDALDPGYVAKFFRVNNSKLRSAPFGFLTSFVGNNETDIAPVELG